MLEKPLTMPACRVLGCLMEKEMATPDYYPLSLNALVNACNQKSNREPVVSFEEMTVVRALDELKAQRLVMQSDVGRVPKYGEHFIKLHNLVSAEAAVICVLLLRGPQTVGELRGRTERLHKFDDLDGVHEVLTTLTELGLVCKMERQPGRKESRYMHLLAGAAAVEEAPVGSAVPEAATLAVRAENDRLDRLEEEIERLNDQLAQLRQEFLAFRRQFE